MYDASKYADYRPSMPQTLAHAPIALRREAGSVGQLLVSDYHLWRRSRALPVSTSLPNGLTEDVAPLPLTSGHVVVHNGDSGCTSGSSKVENCLLSSDSIRHRSIGPRIDVTASLEDGTLRSPDNVSSTLSSPTDVQPTGDLFSPVNTSGRCRLVSLADEYFPVTLGVGRSTDSGQRPVAVAVTTSTSNGRRHHRRHSHHKRHRQHNGQCHSQGHGRPSSGHSSSSSNSHSSVSHVYPAATTSNSAVVNGKLYYSASQKG